MIRILRYLTIALSGLFTLYTLANTGNSGIIILIISLTLLWLFAEPKLPKLHMIFLPLFMAGVVTGLVLNYPLIQQLLLFMLILTSWDIDALYLNSKGITDKDDELKLLYPLLLRETLSFLVILIVWFVSTRITISFGFWPLLIVVLILILLLQKIFKMKI